MERDSAMKQKWMWYAAWLAVISGCTSRTFQNREIFRPSASIASSENSSWKEIEHRGHSYVLYWQGGQSAICHDPDCPCGQNSLAKSGNDAANERDSGDKTIKPTFGLASSKRTVVESDDFEENRFRKIRQADSGQEAEFFDPAKQTWVKGVFKRGFEFEGKLAYFIAEVPGSDAVVFERARIAVVNDSAK
jgi:hypothetical protein